MNCDGRRSTTTPGIFAAVVIAFLVGIAPVTAAEIRLRPESTAAGVILYVGDVADISTPNESLRDEIAKIELGPAPEPGQSRWVDVQDVKDRLFGLGAISNDIIVAGPRRIEVRGASAITNAPDRHVSRDWREEITARIRQQISSAGFGGREVSVQLEPGQSIDFLTRNPEAPWQIVTAGPWQEGWQLVDLVVDAGGERLTFPMRVQLIGEYQVVAARVAIDKGQTLAADDLVLVAHSTGRAGSESLTSVQEAVGMEATRRLGAGETLRTRDLRRPPIVFRGQPITVHINYRTAWIQKTFIAGQDAGLGEWIEVSEAGARNNKVHDYQVRVIGPHTAELPLNAPPSRNALSHAPAPGAPNVRGRRLP